MDCGAWSKKIGNHGVLYGFKGSPKFCIRIFYTDMCICVYYIYMAHTYTHTPRNR